MTESGFQIAQQAASLYELHNSLFMAPFARAIVDAVHMRADSAVLDVACGTGFVTRLVAERLGRDGRVVGADVNQAMINVAREYCPDHVEWVSAPAQTLPFSDAEFDAVLCQQGIQFFPDAVAALVEIQRVLRVNGEIALTIWAPMTGNPYFESQYVSMSSVCGADAIKDFEKAIRPDGAEWLLSIANHAGLAEIQLQQVSATVTLPPAETYVPAQLGSTPWGPLFATLDATQQQEVIEITKRQLAPFTKADGTMDVPFVSHLMTAKRGANSL
jgi:ubiquinone/menaquinone biosynthesis C-methylase UbiE